jgi:hypothetical protein
MAFGASPGYALLAIPVVLAVARASGAGSAIALVVSCGVALGLYAAVLHASGLDEAIYYRFHERFATWNAHLAHRAYVPNVTYHAREAHGDLQLFTHEDIAEPRDVAFHSDSAGFRNDRDYAGEPYVIIGDSFVVGLGTTQAEILQSRLAGYGVRAYNLGQTGGVIDYVSYWERFVAQHGRRARPVLFVFEGNDLPETVGARERAPLWVAFDHAVRDVTAPLTRLSTYRVSRSLVWRVLERGALDGSLIQVVDLAGARFAFLNAETARARARSLEDMALTDAAFERIAPDLAALFFVPTKYRVYQRWVAPGEQLPEAGWQHLAQLCEQLKMACFDLTPALVARSETLLADGRFTWWRDDTHWGGEGIDAAAARVAQTLRDLGQLHAREGLTARSDRTIKGG